MAMLLSLKQTPLVLHVGALCFLHGGAIGGNVGPRDDDVLLARGIYCSLRNGRRGESPRDNVLQRYTCYTVGPSQKSPHDDLHGDALEGRVDPHVCADHLRDVSCDEAPPCARRDRAWGRVASLAVQVFASAMSKRYAVPVLSSVSYLFFPLCCHGRCVRLLHLFRLSSCFLGFILEGTFLWRGVPFHLQRLASLYHR